MSKVIRKQPKWFEFKRPSARWHFGIAAMMFIVMLNIHPSTVKICCFFTLIGSIVLFFIRAYDKDKGFGFEKLDDNDTFLQDDYWERRSEIYSHRISNLYHSSSK